MSEGLLFVFQGLEDEVKGRHFSAVDGIYLKAEEEDKIEGPACKKSKTENT